MDTATIVGLGIGGASVAVALIAWRWPRSPKVESAPHDLLRVEVSNQFPVFDLPDGTRDVGDHLVAVTVRNGTDRPAKITSWGLRLPDGQSVVVLSPTTTWEPRLPHWVQPGDEATWYFDPAELRRIAAEHKIAFESMCAFATVGDGRSLLADRGVPLK